MATLTIQLDPVALREATAQAIMGLLTPELRAQLIQSAISAVLAPSTDSWNKGKSPLEQAFELAVTSLARDLTRQMVAEDDGIREKMQKLLRDTSDKILGADTNKLAERMADAFTSSMRKDY